MSLEQLESKPRLKKNGLDSRFSFFSSFSHFRIFEDFEFKCCLNDSKHVLECFSINYSCFSCLGFEKNRLETRFGFWGSRNPWLGFLGFPSSAGRSSCSAGRSDDRQAGVLPTGRPNLGKCSAGRTLFPAGRTVQFGRPKQGVRQADRGMKNFVIFTCFHCFEP